MDSNVDFYRSPTELWHFGILGQKWGIRRYQNPDGTLTAEGKKRYGSDITRAKKSFVKKQFGAYTPNEGSRTSAIREKISKETEADARVKAFREEDAALVELYNEFQRAHPGKQLVFDSNYYRAYSSLQAEANKALKEVQEKYKNEYASAILQDLGYEVHQKAIDYVNHMLG